jgi:hypothetical protein
LAGPIGNRLGVNRWPEGEPLAGGRQPLAGPIGNRLGVNRWPEGRAKRRRANRWPARSANRLGKPLAGPIGEPY